MDIKTLAIEKAIKLLNGACAKYAILDEHGTKYGTLDIAEPKALPLRRPIQNRGIVEYVRQYLVKLDVGQAVTIPANEHFQASNLQKAGAHLSTKLWGHGAYITHLLKDGVEILRCD